MCVVACVCVRVSERACVRACERVLVCVPVLRTVVNSCCAMPLQESARRIGKVSQEAKLEVDVEEYVEKFRPHIMDIVFAWANGASFAQICKMTDIFEGIA